MGSAKSGRCLKKQFGVLIFLHLQPFGWNLRMRLFDPIVRGISGNLEMGWVGDRSNWQPAHGFISFPLTHIVHLALFELLSWLQKRFHPYLHFLPVWRRYDDNDHSRSYCVVEQQKLKLVYPLWERRSFRRLHFVLPLSGNLQNVIFIYHIIISYHTEWILQR